MHLCSFQVPWGTVVIVTGGLPPVEGPSTGQIWLACSQTYDANEFMTQDRTWHL